MKFAIRFYGTYFTDAVDEDDAIEKLRDLSLENGLMIRNVEEVSKRKEIEP